MRTKDGHVKSQAVRRSVLPFRRRFGSYWNDPSVSPVQRRLSYPTDRGALCLRAHSRPATSIWTKGANVELSFPQVPVLSTSLAVRTVGRDRWYSPSSFGLVKELLLVGTMFIRMIRMRMIRMIVKQIDSGYFVPELMAVALTLEEESKPELNDALFC
ncbi:hypothetical protein BT63DRAFT_457680 [Microthyrium microscopicum]|uniref:Uncharacterized protein n=1 Tax=Microthyrium microscopicum TaxID=703497 RepID=A0A6A6U387_9PEZI|nr:hypothetical protein BT63DRAFT_457680 [Microthyrium microscopicum]